MSDFILNELFLFEMKQLSHRLVSLSIDVSYEHSYRLIHAELWISATRIGVEDLLVLSLKKIIDNISNLKKIS